MLYKGGCEHIHPVLTETRHEAKSNPLQTTESSGALPQAAQDRIALRADRETVPPRSIQ